MTLRKTLNIWSIRPLDISIVPPCQLSEIPKHSWQHLQKEKLFKRFLKNISDYCVKTSFLLFPTPEYFPSSADQAVEASMTVSCSIFDLVGDFEEHFDCKYCQVPASHQQQRTCPSQALEASPRESTADCSPRHGTRSSNRPTARRPTAAQDQRPPTKPQTPWGQDDTREAILAKVAVLATMKSGNQRACNAI